MPEAAQAGQETTTGQQDTTQEHTPEFDGAFDADRAKRAIANLRDSEKALKAKLAELAPKAQELDTLKESQKTELQRLTDQLTAERTAREALEASSLRLSVAMAKGVPAELANRLQGTTQAEIEADADALLAVFTPNPAGVPQASPRQGASGTSRLGADDPMLRVITAKLGIQ